MATTLLGKELTERHYLGQKVVALVLAQALWSMWKSLFGERGDKQPDKGQIATWAAATAAETQKAHTRSIALARDYLYDFTATEMPNVSFLPPGSADIDGDVLTSDTAGMTVDVDVDAVLPEETHSADSVEASEVAEGDVAAEDAPSPGEVESDSDRRARNRKEREAERQAWVVVVPDPPLDAERLEADLREAAESKAAQLERVENPQRREHLARQGFTRTAGEAMKASHQGGQKVIEETAYKTGLRFYRVLGPSPCAFCAVLASNGAVYSDGSWKESDGQFSGPGSAKVHNGCQCSLEPFLSPDQEPPVGVIEAQEIWEDVAKRHKGLTPEGRMRAFRREWERGTGDNVSDRDKRRVRDKKKKGRVNGERPKLTRDAERQKLWNSIVSAKARLRYREDRGIDPSDAANVYDSQQMHKRIRRWEKAGYPNLDWEAETDKGIAIMAEDAKRHDIEDMDRRIAELEDPKAKAAAERIRDNTVWLLAQL